jgi:Sec-independent protein translocase protein TatA
MNMLAPLAFQMPGFGEWIVIAAIGLLLFGKRLPEVGRSLRMLIRAALGRFATLIDLPR